MLTPSVNGATPAKSSCAEPVIIHGLLDIAVEEYAEWQLPRASNGTFRDNINKIRDVTLENCLDLMQIHEDQGPGFFVKHGVKVGAARRFVHDISLWVKRHKEDTDHSINSN